MQALLGPMPDRLFMKDGQKHALSTVYTACICMQIKQFVKQKLVACGPMPYLQRTPLVSLAMTIIDY
ncbi:MAG: hypothetical protein CBC48_05730 [bacterium TMED88]|nr:MAG: hypothetical protein CBC48_05730 [bacterium TMED88]